MDEEITLSIRDIFNMLRKRIKLIIIITLACTLVAGIISIFVMKPVYEAKTNIIVEKPPTYVGIAKSTAVAVKASEKLNNKYTSGQILKAITVINVTNSQIITISAQSVDPKEALNIASAVSDAFVDVSKEVLPSGGTIKVMDKPQLPSAAMKSNKKTNIVIAFLIGLMVSVGLTFILEFTDNTIKTEEDVAKYLDIPIIGIIPREV